MSLARAFTTHRRKPSESDSPPSPSRTFSMRSSTKAFDRSKISSPVALLSTTNTLAYNAPDIATLKTQPIPRSVSKNSAHTPASPSVHSPSAHSSDESDTRSSSTRSVRSRETLTDASSVGSSPSSPQPNHLSEYFKSAAVDTTARRSGSTGPRRSASSSNLQRQATQRSVASDAPSIPQRAPSHSKRAHERMARQRSLHTVRPSIGSVRSVGSGGSASGVAPTSAPTSAPTVPHEPRSSVDMFNRAVEPNHPFGKELEKLNEVAEEFGDAVRSAEWEEDQAVMRARGLKRFCAEEYAVDIQPLFAVAFPPRMAAAGGAWI